MNGETADITVNFEENGEHVSLHFSGLLTDSKIKAVIDAAKADRKNQIAEQIKTMQEEMKKL